MSLNTMIDECHQQPNMTKFVKTKIAPGINFMKFIFTSYHQFVVGFAPTTAARVGHSVLFILQFHLRCFTRICFCHEKIGPIFIKRVTDM